MPEARKHYLYIFICYQPIFPMLFFTVLSEMLRVVYSAEPKYWVFFLYLWSSHCCTIRCESLLKKRINMFWDIVLFWECKDLNIKVGTTTFLISSYLCPRGQSSAPFSGLCIFHLLSEVNIIKNRTWKIICLNPLTLISKKSQALGVLYHVFFIESTKRFGFVFLEL